MLWALNSHGYLVTGTLALSWRHIRHLLGVAFQWELNLYFLSYVIWDVRTQTAFIVSIYIGESVWEWIIVISEELHWEYLIFMFNLGICAGNGGTYHLVFVFCGCWVLKRIVKDSFWALHHESRESMKYPYFEKNCGCLLYCAIYLVDGRDVIEHWWCSEQMCHVFVAGQAMTAMTALCWKTTAVRTQRSSQYLRPYLK